MKDLLEKIEVTPEMRDAGAAILRAGGWGPEDLAVLTYRAMRVLEPVSKRRQRKNREEVLRS
jgi:hypothetical protein